MSLNAEADTNCLFFHIIEVDLQIRSGQDRVGKDSLVPRAVAMTVWFILLFSALSGAIILFHCLAELMERVVVYCTVAFGLFTAR